jgi:beta-N-acetylhexosaminidase
VAITLVLWCDPAMRRGMAVLATVVLLGAGLAGCNTAAPDPDAVTSSVAAMSDEELVGQVLMPYAYGQDATQVSAGAAKANQELAGVDTPAELVRKLHLGGVVLVGFEAGDPTAQDTANVADPQQVRKLTDGLQQAALQGGAKSRLLIATDQEFGVVTRVKTGVTLLPSAMAFGAANQPQLTEAAWKTAGTDLAAMGVNVDLAPVADVQGASNVIGSRSFGADPAVVASQTAAAVKGLQSAGVAATLKHFPGHGRPAADSHSELPLLQQSRADLEKVDLPPFAAGIEAGAKLVMSGHLDVHAIDPGVPASFSAKVLVDLLRNRMGFRGVVVTDALNMTPAQRGTPEQAAVAAFLAGNDLLLMPSAPLSAYNGILTAVKAGTITRERLRESVARILELKAGLSEQAPGLDVLTAAGHGDAVAQAAAAAITVLKGGCTGLTGPVTVTAAKGRDAARDRLTQALRDLGMSVGSAGKVIHLVGYGDTKADLDAKATVTVAMDTPYILAQAASPVRIATYSSSPLSMDALARFLAGKAQAAGRSPVAGNGLPRSAC